MGNRAGVRNTAHQPQPFRSVRHDAGWLWRGETAGRRHSCPRWFSVTPLKAWAGDQLRADRYTLRNTNTWGVALQEQDFWKPGIRAVMFDNNAQTLLGGGSMTVIRENGEGSDGQR
ncbi:type-F conjugative transfer system secretin TraK [Citrobacter meridianamericanus]|uniref:TraK domain-containing protein n=1 Tax=Citrobacter meridianamericanus TaxID=2894201 RepID=UPI00351D6460